DMVATLGETTGICGLRRMRNNMLQHPTGRRILRERPIINSDTIDLNRLRQLPQNTFGQQYIKFLDGHEVSPDTRPPVTLIEDEELAYIMLRYRQVHDFWHALTGLGISVEAELALKWFEFAQAGLPVALLSGVVGPLRLSSDERKRLFNHYVPWAVQCGSSSVFLLNVMYEELLTEDINVVRKNLGFIPPPPQI
ncbi:ubiquinone biosynthesis protein Coq4, partial [Cladochytrium replicatum]